MDELTAITIVVNRADGHHTVRAATPAEAMALLHELELSLGFERDAPVLRAAPGEAVTHVSPPTPIAGPGWRCPVHRGRKPRRSQYRAQWICTYRDPDTEEYCDEHSDEEAA